MSDKYCISISTFVIILNKLVTTKLFYAWVVFIFQALYRETKLQLEIAHGKIDQLSRIDYTSKQRREFQLGHEASENILSREIDEIIENIKKNCNKLDVLVSKEPAEGARRANIKFRVDQLKTDIRCLQSSHASLKNKSLQRQKHNMEREKLLNTTFTTNAEAAKQNDHTQNLNESMKSTSILIDHALIQNEALGRSNRAIDDILKQGSTMIGEKH